MSVSLKGGFSLTVDFKFVCSRQYKGRRGNFKIVVVGAGAVGKTNVALALSNGEFADDYIPTVFDNFLMKSKFMNEEYSINLFDTAGQEDYDRVRPLSFPEADLFLVCFSVCDPISLEEAQEKFCEEIRDVFKGNHPPFTPPFIIVGCKSDLRSDTAVQMELHERDEKFVTVLEAEKMAKKVGALGYFEVSAKTRTGISALLGECCKVKKFFRVFKLQKSGLFGIKKTKKIAFEEWKKISKGKSSTLLQVMEKDFAKKATEFSLEIKKRLKKERKDYNDFSVLCRTGLSHDVVCHLLSEFVLIDFQDLLEFNPKYFFLNQDKTLLQFFGYFRSDEEGKLKTRKIFQLFYSFRCGGDQRDMFSNQLLPTRRKFLIIEKSRHQGPTTKIQMEYRHYFSKDFHVVRCVGRTFFPLKKKLLLHYAPKLLSKLMALELFSPTYLWIQSVDKLLMRSNELKVLKLGCAMFRKKNTNSPSTLFFSKMLKLELVQEKPYVMKHGLLQFLKLRNVFERSFTFKNLTSLVVLDLSNNSKKEDNSYEVGHFQLSKKQFVALMEIKSLKFLSIEEMGFKNIPDLHLVFQNPSLEVIWLWNNYGLDLSSLKKINQIERLGMSIRYLFFRLNTEKIVGYDKDFPTEFVSYLKEKKKSLGEEFQYDVKVHAKPPTKEEVELIEKRRIEVQRIQKTYEGQISFKKK